MADGVEKGGGKDQPDQQRHVETVVRTPEELAAKPISLDTGKRVDSPGSVGGPSSSVSIGNSAVRDPVIGITVNGYVVRGKLGTGGMGIVYSGDHPVIGKRAAIKVLRPEIAENEEQVKRLVSEARAVNAVGHRGIIDVFGYDTLPDGRQCIVMEYLDGEPLSDTLTRNRKEKNLMPLPQVMVVLEEILSALGAAHSAGVIHRDLKPSNIFLCKQRDGMSYVKLLDFGIAKLGVLGSTPQTRASMLVGTPSYMAPEQARGGAVTPAMDLYAVGIIAFEMLTGELPFTGDSVVEVLMKHAEEPPRKPSSLLMSIPDDLDEMVLKLLAKEPGNRYQSADEVHECVTRIRKTLSESTARSIGLSLGKSIFRSGSTAPEPAPSVAPQRPAPAAPKASTLNAPVVASDTRFDVVPPPPAAAPEPPANETMTVPRAVPSRQLAAPAAPKSKGLLYGTVALAVGALALGAAYFMRQPAPEGAAPIQPQGEPAPTEAARAEAGRVEAERAEAAKALAAAAEQKAKQEAEAKAQREAEEKARQEAKAKAEAEELAKAQAAEKARAEAAKKPDPALAKKEPAVKKEPTPKPVSPTAKPGQADRLLSRFLMLQKLNEEKPDALSAIDKKILGKYLEALRSGTIKPEQRDQAETFANKAEAELKGQ